MRNVHDWTRHLRIRADAPPPTARQVLRVTGSVSPFGSMEAALARQMLDAGLPLQETDSGWQVAEPVEASLERIARWVCANLPGARWRDERLDVADASGRVLGTVERSAVRPLGIATHAVHLVGTTANGRVWVQQRAADKAVDPGRWDTLMGGLIAAGESVATALERETWEEAGLRIEPLADVREFARFTVRRPVADGYMVEHIHCYQAGVPDGFEPVNQDGEVQRFEALDRAALVERLEADVFTLEAALVLLRWLERDTDLGS